MQKVRVSLVSCESMQDSAKNPRHVPGYEKALTPDWTAVPLSIKSKERERLEGRQTYDQKKKSKKVLYAVREKQKLWKETGAQRRFWRRRGAEEERQEERWRSPLLWVRLQHSDPLLWAQTEDEDEDDWGWSQSQGPSLSHFPYIPTFLFKWTISSAFFFTHIASILPLFLCHLLFLCLSYSLGAIFTSKRLHYLPSLKAIRNGVTLSCRHCHCFITTHPLSWEPFVETADIDGEDTGASSVHPPLHIPSPPPTASPSFWLVNCGVNGV